MTIANPYHAKKIENDEQELEELERGFKDANSALYEATKEVLKTKKEEFGDTEEEEAKEPDDKKYKRVDWQKRYSDLRRHFEKEKAKWAAGNTGNEVSLPQNEEELAEFKANNPKLYAMIERMAERTSTNKMKEVNGKLESTEKELAELRQKKAIAELNSAVPDWQEITQSDRFQEWATEQPEEIQNWVFNNPDNAALAIKAIKLYKADFPDNQKTKTKSSGSSADSVSVKSKVSEPTSRKKVWTTSEIEKMSPSQFEKNVKDIDAAFLEGRVVKA